MTASQLTSATLHFTHRTARAAFGVAVDLLYPERCVNCGAFGASFCDSCEARMLDAPPIPRCAFCRGHWDGKDNCPRCFELQALDGVRAVADYEGPARRLVLSLKYRYTLPVVPVMARHLQPLFDDEAFDAVVPVPLHPSRQRYRGFNQAELLHRELGLPQPPGQLLRVRRTRAQYALTSVGRAANVAGAFAYHGDALEGLRVAILDDVVTTGATANECARVLRDQGAASVTAVAFARANYGPTSPDDALHI
jgi:ComF family protein